MIAVTASARVCALLAAAALPLLTPPGLPAASAATELLPVQPYCVPGVTAARCRGIFWETGKLYKKETYAATLSPAEYEAGVAALFRARRTLAAASGDGEVGTAASLARAELRRTGGRLCGALDAEVRYDLEFVLNEALAALDDVDAADSALRAADEPSRVAPGFGEASLLMRPALRAVDAFLHALPPTPEGVWQSLPDGPQ